MAEKPGSNSTLQFRATLTGAWLGSAPPHAHSNSPATPAFSRTKINEMTRELWARP